MFTTPRRHVRRLTRVLTMVAFTLVGCSGCHESATETHHNTPNPSVSEQVPLRFYSHIEQISDLRVIASQWETGDEVGLYILPGGSSQGKTEPLEGYANLPMVREQDGVFYLKDKFILFFPGSPETLDFVAYYPYRKMGEDHLYPLDLRESPDFLYASDLKNFSPQAYKDAHLVFHRPLSKLGVIVETPKDLTISVRVLGISITGTFDLMKGAMTPSSEKGNLAISTSRDGDYMVAKAPLFPGEKEVIIEITCGKNKYKYRIPEPLQPGKEYKYTFRLSGNELVPGLPSYAYLEMPSPGSGRISSGDVQQVLHLAKASWLNNPRNGVAEPRNYSILYDRKLRMPLWVAYLIHGTYMGSAKRTDAWDYDPSVDRALQPNLSSSWKQPKGIYDRGHMMPSGSRNATRDLNKTTFYFTNMAAQIGKTFNQASWQRLETKVRTWQSSNAGDTLYVVVGCIPFPEPERSKSLAYDRDGNASAVPQYMYKLLLKRDKTTGKYKSIAFNFLNEENAKEYSDPSVYTTVEEIEKLTGFTFFPGVPREVKQQRNLKDWQ